MNKHIFKLEEETNKVWNEETKSFEEFIELNKKENMEEREIKIIQCPECGKVQKAVVSFAPLIGWGDYIHECESCAFLIMESEWEEVKEKPFAHLTDSTSKL